MVYIWDLETGESIVGWFSTSLFSALFLPGFVTFVSAKSVINIDRNLFGVFPCVQCADLAKILFTYRFLLLC